jgi:hypothetical protein
MKAVAYSTYNVEVAMADLHDDATRERSTLITQIDTAGWVFLILAVAIVGLAGVIAYNGNNTMPDRMSHVASR